MVERVEHFRYLDFTLDNHLNFNQHTLDIYKRFQKTYNYL